MAHGIFLHFSFMYTDSKVIECVIADIAQKGQHQITITTTVTLTLTQNPPTTAVPGQSSALQPSQAQSTFIIISLSIWCFYCIS